MQDQDIHTFDAPTSMAENIAVGGDLLSLQTHLYTNNYLAY